MGIARTKTSPGDLAGMAFAMALFSLIIVTPTGNVEATPATPVIDLVVASRGTVFTSESSEVFCVAHHDDGMPLTYIWSSAAGMLIPSVDSAVWFAPEEPGTYAIAVEVSDDAGASSNNSVIITVVQNEPPIVMSVTAEPALLSPGESATLFCEAKDIEGHAIEYEWVAPPGIISGTGPRVTWTAPARPGQHYVPVRVTDEMGASRTRNVMISVRCPEPPVIQELLVWPVLPDYSKFDAHGDYRLLRGSLTKCELQCVALVSYGDLTYEWSCTEGTIEGEGAIVLFTPPDATTGVYVTAKVIDSCGKSAVKELFFRIYQGDEYPTAAESLPGCMRCLYGY
jgi:hypothetical protein